jgi:hypothetical protein
LSYPSKSIGEGWLQQQHRGPMHRTAVHEKIARGQYIADAQVPWLAVCLANQLRRGLECLYCSDLPRLRPRRFLGAWWASRAAVVPRKPSLSISTLVYTPVFGRGTNRYGMAQPAAFKASLNARAARNCASRSKLCRAKMLGLVCAITFRTARIFWSFPRRMSRDKSLGAVRSRPVVEVARRTV